MKTCSHCHATPPDDAPGGLCPQCLLQGVLSPGDQIQYFGNYELLEEIALGGMGVVWRAKQTSLNRVVALKMIRGGILATPDELQRFRTEAEAAANLQHPNIVAIHEVGEHDGQHYFSMDFVEGQNLAAFCDGKPLPAKQAAELIATIADAAQFAHQRGILHRDLKPQNVMIDASGAPHLTDFGLAKRMDIDSGLTQTGAVMGSPSYMAPEQAQARHDRVGTHTDVYSLGAILYEMLTGRAPFRAETPAETMMRVISDEPVAPSNIDATIPRDLETVCLKCLEKEPSRRYATARDLAEDVRRFLQGEPVVARPASAWRKAESWVCRHPWTLAATAAMLVLLLACAVDFLFEQNRFLRAQQITPGLQRVSGARSIQLKMLNGVAALFYLVVVWTWMIMMKQSRRLTRWKDFCDPKQVWKPRSPVSTRMALVCLLIALACVGFSFFMLAKCLEVFVWEAGAPLAVPLDFALVLFAFMIIAETLRSLRGGVTVPSLSAEARAQVEALILEGEYVGAVRQVRHAAPGTGLAAANATVERMAAQIEAAAPGTLVPPGLHRKMNVTAFGICLCIETLVLTAFYVMWAPPANTMPFTFDFATGFVFGAGLFGGIRVPSFWKKMLLLLPMFVMLALCALVKQLQYHDADKLHLAPYFTGSIFGGTLLLCSFMYRQRARA